MQAGEADSAAAMNVQLSLDETYADITPVRHNPDSISAFVSIMRGCNNSESAAPSAGCYCYAAACSRLSGFLEQSYTSGCTC